MLRPCIAFRLAARSTFLDIDGRSLLFSETQQQIFELNEAAACLVQALSDPEQQPDFANLVETLCALGLDHDAAVSLVRESLCAWSQAGIVEVVVPLPFCSTAVTQCIVLGVERHAIHYETQRTAGLVAPTLAHLETNSGELHVHWHLIDHAGLVLIGKKGDSFVAVQSDRAAPALKYWLAEELLHTSTEFTALHAACLVHGGKALLLLGAPGAGKSTLAARLESAGFGFGGDDLCFLGHDGKVRAVPFALTAKPGAWPVLLPFRPDLPDCPAHQRLDAKTVRYLPPLNPMPQQPLPLGWTVLLRRKDGAAATLVPRHRADALSDVLGEAYSSRNGTSSADLDMVLRTLGGASSFELRYSDVDDAAQVLRGLCGVA